MVKQDIGNLLLPPEYSSLKCSPSLRAGAPTRAQTHDQRCSRCPGMPANCCFACTAFKQCQVQLAQLTVPRAQACAHPFASIFTKSCRIYHLQLDDCTIWSQNYSIHKRIPPAKVARGKHKSRQLFWCYLVLCSCICTICYQLLDNLSMSITCRTHQRRVAL